MSVPKPSRIAFFAACMLAIIATLTLAQQKTNRSRSLKYVPRDALAVISVQIQSLLSSQTLAASSTEIGEQPLPVLQIPISKVTDVTFVLLNGGAYTKFNLTPEGKQLLWKRVNSTGKETVLDGVKYFKNRDGVFHQLEDGATVLASSEVVLLQALKTESAETTIWADQWYASKSPVVALVNTSLLRASSIIQDLSLPQQRAGIRPNADIFSLAFRSERIWVEFQSDPAPALSVRGQCPTPEEAASFESGLRTAISFGRNLISLARTNVLDPSKGGKGEAIPIMDFLDRVLEFATVQRKESQVAALARVSEADSKKLPGLLSLALRTFAVGQNRASTQYNLKQIALAMHNYESAYKRLPAAVQEGPNKTPRSWRVTILPFLDTGDLYLRYKQDEPWDSPSNLKLLDEIPSVFRGSKGGTNSGYFVFSGTNAIFNRNVGPKLAEISDGTSNTILAIEADLDIPWTKPEDIPFEMNQDLPDFLKKGFNAVLADGSFHFIPPNSDEKLLKAAISKNDGEVHNLFER